MPTEPSEAEEIQRAAREIVEAQIRLFGSLYDKSSTYTNLVMAAGYAGVFALWSLVREHLLRTEALMVAALLLVSLSAFVFFEIYKIFGVSLAMRRRAQAFDDSIDELSRDVDAFVKKIERIETENAHHELRTGRIWPWSWGVSVVCGLAAVAILLGSIFERLLSGR